MMAVVPYMVFDQLDDLDLEPVTKKTTVLIMLHFKHQIISRYCIDSKVILEL